MDKQKLIRALCLSLVLIIGVAPTVVNAQSMETALLTANRIPVQDPYCAGAYPPLATVGSLTDEQKPVLCPTTPATALTTVPANVVDWVLLELRTVSGSNTSADDAAAANVIARKPAFLLSNGRVVDAELYTGEDPSSCTGVDEHANCPDVVFEEGDIASSISGNELYLVVRHRNHLDIISANNLTESGSGVYAYDFSTNVDTARGGATGLNTVNASVGGVATPTPAMYGGDVDGNTNVNFEDYNVSSDSGINGIRVNNGQTTYLASDTDMNSNTNFEDYNAIVRLNNGRASQVP